VILLISKRTNGQSKVVSSLFPGNLAYPLYYT
jgi:hypothetical protein